MGFGRHIPSDAVKWLGLCLLLASCDRHPGCDDVEVEASLDRVVEVLPQLAEVADRMRVFCSWDVSDACLFDVDACTIGIGSPLADGRTAVNLRVPMVNALAHESQHWRQMQDGDCFGHAVQCGFSAETVEQIQGP